MTHRTDPPPWNRLFGPVHARGPMSGVILRNGVEVAQWGEPDRADLTFSVAKTYLALLAGIANRDGLLPDPDEPVVKRLPGIGFDEAHNREVTWMHLLTQTSEWGGTVHGIDDVADRYRQTAHAPTFPLMSGLLALGSMHGLADKISRPSGMTNSYVVVNSLPPTIANGSSSAVKIT